MDDASQSKIPKAKGDDLEDVSWALSTAEAMWTRGEHADAIKWVRKAVEAASEGGADLRALELAKLAAELANETSPHGVAATVVTSALGSALPSLALSPAPAPVVVVDATSRRSAAPRPLQSTQPGKPKPSGRPLATNLGPKPGALPSGVRPQPPKPISKPPSKSAPPESIELSSFVEENEAPPSDQRTPVPANAEPVKSPTLPEWSTPANHANTVAPAAEDLSQTVAMNGPITQSHAHVHSSAAQSANEHSESSVDNSVDQSWSQVPSRESRDGIEVNVSMVPPEEKTSAMMAMPTEIPRGRIPNFAGPKLKQTQAVRVIVWKDAAGVHIAPQGTLVSAITVDAMLVALDEHADLGAWLGSEKPRSK
jgi:hypothetical protein